MFMIFYALAFGSNVRAHLTVDVSTPKASGQKSHIRLRNWLQKVLGEGSSLDCASLLHVGSFALSPMPGRLEKVTELVDEVVAKGSCSSSEAGVLCGECTFIGSQLQGRGVGGRGGSVFPSRP